eukprot:Amastigsp_a841972_24.p2 type:complete len:184 gc:universal Amastigsp_a841972_24:1261-710(-)
MLCGAGVTSALPFWVARDVEEVTGVCIGHLELDLVLVDVANVEVPRRERLLQLFDPIEVFGTLGTHASRAFAVDCEMVWREDERRKEGVHHHVQPGALVADVGPPVPLEASDPLGALDRVTSGVVEEVRGLIGADRLGVLSCAPLGELRRKIDFRRSDVVPHASHKGDNGIGNDVCRGDGGKL